jgi:hypothetical protein
MLIVCYENDIPTMYASYFARKFCKGEVLINPTKEELMEKAKRHNAIVIVSHGKAYGIIGNGKVIVGGNDNVRKVVYAFTCWTGLDIGKKLASKGATFIGFTDEVLFPFEGNPESDYAAEQFFEPFFKHINVLEGDPYLFYVLTREEVKRKVDELLKRGDGKSVEVAKWLLWNLGNFVYYDRDNVYREEIALYILPLPLILGSLWGRLR